MSVQLMRGIRYLGGDMFRVVRALMAWLLIASIGMLSACGGGSGTTFGGAPSGGGDTTQAPTIALTLSGTTTSSTAPITAIATVLTATGTPVPGVVVSFSSTSGLGSPSVPTALTNALGQASVTLFPALGVTVGADLLNASSTVNSTQIATALGFQVVPSVSASGLSLSLSSDTVTATAEVTVNALVRDAAGAPVAGQVVNFTSGAGLGVLSAPSALSDATGLATVKLTPKPGVTVGADFVTATTSIASVSLSASRGFQIAGGTASSSGISVAISSATVTDAIPATVTATVKGSDGQPAIQQVVTFSTTGVGALSAPTALTDASGIASVTIRPAAGAPSGAADSVVASVSLGGLIFQAQQSFQLGGTNATAPHLTVALSTPSVTSAAPATVTVTLTDGSAQPVSGQVVTLSTAAGFGVLSAASVLTDGVGKAQVLLFAKAGLTSGADILSASASVSGVAVAGQVGFEVAGATAAISSFTSDLLASTSLSAYGQTNLTGTISGLATGTPVGLSVSSTCVAKGKASITPSSLTTTSGNASFTYRDNGCGATDSKDDISLAIVGTTVSRSLSFPIAAPSVGSVTFVSAVPDKIFLRGSGFTETSVVSFSVLDLAGNPLPNQDVELKLTTVAGGLTIDGQPGLSVTKRSDANGKVTVLVNSGTVPTPVRVQATLKDSSPTIGTVSSTLAIAVGLPAQLNFSLSQGAHNIEGASLDGASNTYGVIASDRLSNPVPDGTAINFVAEGGSIEGIKQVVRGEDGLSRVTANFASASPRPANGRITVVAYALGEESFLDRNGNNIFDIGEDFLDLGDVFIDRKFDGSWDQNTDQFISLSISQSSACRSPTSPLLSADAVTPTIPSTCDGVWGRAYVRKAIETVLSTSEARPLWAVPPDALDSGCSIVQLFDDPTEDAAIRPRQEFFAVGAGGAYGLPSSGSITFLVADANDVRLNPMAARTTISASSQTQGLTAQVVGGSPVPSTPTASRATVAYSFTSVGGVPVTSGTIFLTFGSPSGLQTTIPLRISTLQPASLCPP